MEVSSPLATEGEVLTHNLIMRILAAIAGVLLGLIFIALSSMYLFHFGPPPPPFPAGSPAAMFMGAVVPTGYFTFVKVCELIGGVLVLFPASRNYGLLLLGPIVANILAFNICLVGNNAVMQPPVIAVTVLTVLAVLCGWRGFATPAKKA